VGHGVANKPYRINVCEGGDDSETAPTLNNVAECCGLHLLGFISVQTVLVHIVWSYQRHQSSAHSVVNIHMNARHRERSCRKFDTHYVSLCYVTFTDP